MACNVMTRRGFFAALAAVKVGDAVGKGSSHRAFSPISLVQIPPASPALCAGQGPISCYSDRIFQYVMNVSYRPWRPGELVYWCHPNRREVAGVAIAPIKPGRYGFIQLSEPVAIRYDDLERVEV